MGHCLFLRKGEVHTAPVTGVLASSLAVGSTVKLMEGGTAVEYLVVNQGIPENSSLYDASCNGTWLLRKDIHSLKEWNASTVNTYGNSTINTWLNGDFFNSLGAIEQTAIKQVKIPYCDGAGSITINSGANGLSVKCFLLGGSEVGETATTYVPVDGAMLSYFESGSGASAKNKRLANYNGATSGYWLRTPSSNTSITGNRIAGCVDSSGAINSAAVRNSFGIRPAIILSNNALFDKATMLLTGVK